jgi:HSP20 family protein
MAVDLVERDDTFVVTADLPGFERDDVEVTVTDHTLRIEAGGETTDREEDEEGRYLRQERRHRSVDRSVRLPEEVDTDAATGTMRHGVLTVTLPKLIVEEAHQVEID